MTVDERGSSCSRPTKLGIATPQCERVHACVCERERKCVCHGVSVCVRVYVFASGRERMSERQRDGISVCVFGKSAKISN